LEITQSLKTQVVRTIIVPPLSEILPETLHV